MNLEEKKNILLDILDGIPPENNIVGEELSYRKEIEYNFHNLKRYASELGISCELNEYQGDNF